MSFFLTFFVPLEPIGTTLPKFSTAMIGLVSMKQGAITSLTCPAQAFPSPNSRYKHICGLMISILDYHESYTLLWSNIMNVGVTVTPLMSNLNYCSMHVVIFGISMNRGLAHTNDNRSIVADWTKWWFALWNKRLQLYRMTLPKHQVFAYKWKM